MVLPGAFMHGNESKRKKTREFQKEKTPRTGQIPLRQQPWFDVVN